MKSFRIMFPLILLVVAGVVWAAGQRVLGQWGDGYWYPATVVAENNGLFSVAFDDGDTANVDESKIREIDWKAGSAVECNWKSGGVYYKGFITKKNGDSIHVSYEDGDQEDTTIGKCRSR